MRSMKQSLSKDEKICVETPLIIVQVQQLTIKGTIIHIFLRNDIKYTVDLCS